MTLDDVKQRVAEIRAIGRRDPEVSHGNEDALWENVLRAIADGAPNAAELAREALETAKIDFARWCA